MYIYTDTKKKEDIRYKKEELENDIEEIECGYILAIFHS